MSRTPYLVAASVASLVAGAAIGATLLVPSAVNAAGSDTTDTTVAPSTTPAVPAPPKDSWVDHALQPLVDAGTLTKAQADAVKDALSKAGPAFPGPGGHKPGPPFGGPIGKDPAKIAGALGISEADLRAALATGKSLADLAKEHGKDPAAIVQVIIDDLNARVDAAVTAGRLSQGQADQMNADAKTRAEAVVNGTAPFGPGPWGRHRGGFGGRDGFGPPPEAAAPASDSVTA